LSVFEVRAPVTERGSLGAYIVLSMHAPAIAAVVEPGQFVQIDVPGCMLRRPFSVYRRSDAGAISIAFDAIGAGTLSLATRAPGDVLRVLGPLGTGFEPTQGPALLVGGGYGTAALTFLAQRLRGDVHALVGARSAGRLFVDDALRERCATISITTDDGSEGTKGVVTQVMPGLLSALKIARIYACGPNPMLAAVGGVASTAGVPASLAVEEFMACGIGVCWTCVLPVRVGGKVKHQRVCTEGPVFEAEAVAWA
jgi:dihydroorotate dehydrogenase electron transfer subunit